MKTRRSPVKTGQSVDKVAGKQKRIPAIFFCTETGAEPLRKWLKGLTAEDRKRIGEDIKTAEFGWPIGMPVCRPRGEGMYEIRTKLDAEQNCQSSVLYRQKVANGFASRIHQENPQDAE